MLVRAGVIAGWALLCAAGCATEPEVHPMAYFTVGPRFICEGDEHATAVRFDARQSSGATQLLIAGETRVDFGVLTLRWRIDPDVYRLVEGDLGSEVLVLTLAGDRSVQVRLDVSNGAGETATAEETVGLVVPTAQVCDEAGAACGDNERCAAYGGSLRCLPDRECVAAADCPACYRCDSGLCVP